MDCGFSEFSFGDAAIREAEAELAQIYRSAGAPVLPSLLQEEHLGWDVQLKFVEYVLFLQFKRVEYVSRRHPASPTWPFVGAPHYRFSIDTDGHQHAALFALQLSLASGPDPGHVYYAAPTFHEQRDFDLAYSQGAVLHQSSLIAPSEFALDNGLHHVVTGGQGTWILSDPRRPEKQTSWDSMTGNVRSRASAARERGRERGMTVGRLAEAVESSLGRLGRDLPRDIDAPITRRLQRWAAVLGCGLLLFLVDQQGDEGSAYGSSDRRQRHTAAVLCTSGPR
jgi:hypothetical protein